jgi:hypothetical protein
VNVNGVNDVRQTEIHTALPIVLELSAFEVEMAIANLTKFQKGVYYSRIKINNFPHELKY